MNGRDPSPLGEAPRQVSSLAIAPHQQPFDQIPIQLGNPEEDCGQRMPAANDVAMQKRESSPGPGRSPPFCLPSLAPGWGLAGAGLGLGVEDGCLVDDRVPKPC
jgi:hypothetical protein